jgi:NAD(P)H dehydrogenase (quinone)
VYTSHPHPGAGNPLGQVAEEHGETEEMLHDSGIAWTVLRFGTFAELQVQPAALAVAAGKLVTNGGAGRIVPISRRDCAEAAAVVLTTSGHGGKTYDITGPESLSQSDLAAIYGEVSGRSVKVVPIGDKMLVMGLVLHGTPRPVARAIADFGRAVREGYFDVVDPAFEGLCGRPPVSLREVLIPHRGDLLEVA